jgi:hypothetical protein
MQIQGRQLGQARDPASRLRSAGKEPRRGTLVASQVAGLRSMPVRQKEESPRDADTKGGNQPADKSLINRRLYAPSPALCSHRHPTPGLIPRSPVNCCSTLDRGHKRLAEEETFEPSLSERRTRRIAANERYRLAWRSVTPPPQARPSQRGSGTRRLRRTSRQCGPPRC